MGRRRWWVRGGEQGGRGGRGGQGGRGGRRGGVDGKEVVVVDNRRREKRSMGKRRMLDRNIWQLKGDWT